MGARRQDAELESLLASEREARARAEAAESALRTIIGAAPLPIVSLDVEGNVTSWNRAAEAIFGWNETDVLGKPSPTIPEDEKPASDAVLRHVLEGETVRGLRRTRRRKDGSSIELSIYTAPQLDAQGQVVGTVILAEDITEAVRAQEERELLLRAEQEARDQAVLAGRRFRFLAEAGSELSSSLDYETTLGSVARLAVPRIADWCSVLVVERDGEARQLATAHVDPAKVQLAEQLAVEYPYDPEGTTGAPAVIRSGAPELIREIPDELLEQVSPDERILGILRDLGLKSSMTVPMVARSRVVGAITFVSAESGHLFGEDDLLLAEELASRAALAVDNARLYREVVELVGQKDEFLAAAAHDLKNPLAIMKTLAQMLSKRVAREETPDVPRLLDVLSRIDVAATRMAGQINELLDIARLQMDRPLDLDRRPADLLPVLAEAVDEYRHLTDRHCICFSSSVQTLPGDWDVVRLERAISNLLSNAVKFSPEGGEILVSINVEEGGSEGWATITIRDRGIGIPGRDLPHVFERFYRGENVTRRIAGTGIGLFGVRQVVEQHGGRVAIESELGAGTHVSVRLPLRPMDEGVVSDGKGYRDEA
ncbi:MAG TPA: PAS domain-containing sensor histidine kinase [Chloroflexota bacterium]|nr:PAS domain-containing sensor histidine kinase [Chloroflexota bacterium]